MEANDSTLVVKREIHEPVDNEAKDQTDADTNAIVKGETSVDISDDNETETSSSDGSDDEEEVYICAVSDLDEDEVEAENCVKCFYCDFQANGQVEVDNHVFRQHVNDPDLTPAFSCSNCDVLNWTKKCLHDHLQASHKSNGDQSHHVCTYCGETFLSRILLEDHRNIVHSQVRKRPYFKSDGENLQCPLCSYCPKAMHMLRKHMKIHERPSEYFCHRCGYKCKFHLDLQVHLRNNCKKKVLYECDTCGKHFNRLRCHRNHVNTVHKGIKNWKCVLCDATFSSKYNLGEHERKAHDVAKDLCCDKCDFSTTSRSAWNDHAKSAHPKVPLLIKCDHCEFTCDKQSTLRHHLMYTHQQKDNKCSHCQASFCFPYQLKRHLVSKHIEAKLFACAFCDYGANDRRWVRKHVKKQHPEKPMDNSAIVESFKTKELTDLSDNKNESSSAR